VIPFGDALRITAQEFPYGPEKLAEHLNIAIQATPLKGVEGWCVRGANTVIRLNSTSSPYRQRFTLAHELAHLILGTSPDIATEPFRSNRQEERDADQLASRFLISDIHLKAQVEGKLPLDSKALERLAKAANVSPVMAACRVVNDAEALGLQNAAVVFFANGLEQWRYSHGLEFNENAANSLFRLAMESKPKLIRKPNDDEYVVVGSIIDAQAYQVLFVQLLPKVAASQETYEEQIRDLGEKLFGDDHNFRQGIAARFGTCKNKCTGQSLEKAIEFFYHTYVGKAYTGLRQIKLNSQIGKKYVRLYLQRWFK